MKKIPFLFLLFYLTSSFLVFAQLTIKDQEGSPNILIQVNDEGKVGSITLPDTTEPPSDITNKLYNLGGTLNWNGSALSTSGSSLWTLNGSKIYYSAGNVGIGTSSPIGALHISGNEAVIFDGNFGSGTTLNLESGIRMMWYPKKGAFRSGFASGTEWDDANIGDYSTALGDNVKASGNYSFASGRGNTASGEYSVAMGFGNLASGSWAVALGDMTTASGDGATALGDNTTASGHVCTAIGNNTTASGWVATALGDNTTASGPACTAIGLYSSASGNVATAIGDEAIASGETSTALGKYTKAEAKYSTSVGSFNIGGGNPTEWIDTDPLFELGNGQDAENRSNAMTILKNGNVGQGTTTPSTKLQVDGNITFAPAGKSSNESRFMGQILAGAGSFNAALGFGGMEIENIDVGGTDDSEQQIHFWTHDQGVSSERRMTIDIGGNVGIGTDSPGSKLSIVGLSEYADNTAAIAAGLAEGDLYRTGDLLKIVH